MKTNFSREEGAGLQVTRKTSANPFELCALFFLRSNYLDDGGIRRSCQARRASDKAFSYSRRVFSASSSAVKRLEMVLRAEAARREAISGLRSSSHIARAS